MLMQLILISIPKACDVTRFTGQGQMSHVLHIKWGNYQIHFLHFGSSIQALSNKNNFKEVLSIFLF